MRSLLAERLGSQEPVVLHLPPGVVSHAAAKETIELADAYGVCAATRIAEFGPRQGTGKNDKIAAWELAQLLLFGTELIIHTAHEFPTANESFLRLGAVFDAHDELGREVARIRYANGD